MMAAKTLACFNFCVFVLKFLYLNALLQNFTPCQLRLGFFFSFLISGFNFASLDCSWVDLCQKNIFFYHAHRFAWLTLKNSLSFSLLFLFKFMSFSIGGTETLLSCKFCATYLLGIHELLDFISGNNQAVSLVDLGVLLNSDTQIGY